MSATAGPLPRVGMPMLSGPPPISESSTCRQCTKSFNILTRRAHACGHCGYEYCPSCLADGQALMPRRSSRSGAAGGAGGGGAGSYAGPGAGAGGGGPGGLSSSNGMGRLGAFFSDIADTLGLDDRDSGRQGSGYDPDKVCARCYTMLQVTSAPIDRLRTLPIKLLKEYLAAYNITLLGPKEKEDFVQAVVKARNPATGCLSPESESYYRRHSVPSGNTPTPQNGRPPPSHPTARPPPPHRPPPTSHPRPPPPRTSPAPSTTRDYGYNPRLPFRPPPASTHWWRDPASPSQGQGQGLAQSHPPAGSPQYRPTPSQPHTHRPSPGRPASTPTANGRPTSAVPARAQARSQPSPLPPVPTILSLVSLPRSYLSSMSIGTLKAILYENHVRVDFKQVLEKEELVARVWELVSAERRRLERQRYEEEREAQLAAQAQAQSQSQARTAVSSNLETAEISSHDAPDGDGENAAGKASGDGDGVDGSGTDTVSNGSEAPDIASVPTGPMPEIERGLCVVCQDEEATLAVVDCGHLCMCAPCSDLVMATSKECPLCRTRIVTSHRLIRIYKV